MESVPNVSILIRPKRQNDTGLDIGNPSLRDPVGRVLYMSLTELFRVPIMPITAASLDTQNRGTENHGGGKASDATRNLDVQWECS